MEEYTSEITVPKKVRLFLNNDRGVIIPRLFKRDALDALAKYVSSFKDDNDPVDPEYTATLEANISKADIGVIELPITGSSCGEAGHVLVEGWKWNKL